MNQDDPELLNRIQALWLLLWPSIEAKARELGAQPLDLAVALTIGSAHCVAAAAPAQHRRQMMITASVLFTEVLAALTTEGEG